MEPPPDPETPNLGASWPPPIAGRGLEPAADVPRDPADEFLHRGWRLLVLGFCCAPPVFLPLAAWQAVAASRCRSGAGTRLLLAAGGVAALWILALLLFIFVRR